MSELEAIRKRAEAATKGPWVPHDLADGAYSPKDDTGWWWVWQESKLPYYGAVLNPNDRTDKGVADGSIGECMIDDNETGVQEKSDAEFIAYARTDVPRLLAALEAVTALADAPDITLTHPKGDKTFLIEAHRIRSAITTALEGAV